jgi:hypothetical protein
MSPPSTRKARHPLLLLSYLLPLFLLHLLPLMDALAAGVSDSGSGLRVVLYSHSDEWGRRAPDRLRHCGAGQLLCETTWNDSRRSEASALLFHAPDELSGELSEALLNDPARRPLYYFTDEAPPSYATSAFLQQFDLVSTYDLLSDAPRPYFIGPDLLKAMRSRGEQAMEDGRLDVLLSSLQRKLDRARSGHLAPIAWFVSNCGAGRSLYVAELMKVIAVDIYSSPNSRCLGTNLTLPSRFSVNATAVEDGLLRSDYLFYLALESRNCRDYATEKLFRPLNTGVLPIVDGPVDYSPFLPTSHSALRLDDYASPAQLAAHVSYLLHHLTDYARYLNFSSLSPTFVQANDHNYDGWCQMCEHAFRAKTEVKGRGQFERFHSRYRYPQQQLCQLNKWEKLRTPQTTIAASYDSHQYSGPRMSADDWWAQWDGEASLSLGDVHSIGRYHLHPQKGDRFFPICPPQAETTWPAVLAASEALLLLLIAARCCPRRLPGWGGRGGGRTDLLSPLRSLPALGHDS